MNSIIERIQQRLDQLGGISDDNNCLSRFYGTKAHFEAGELLKKWMQESGMNTWTDSIGNIRGILKSESPNAKHFVIGSHFDTVFDAGKFDGPLGIILGLEMVIRIWEEKITLPFHLNLIAFADEEGSRFNTAYLGSSVIAGNFDREWLDRMDDSGMTLLQVIEKQGGKTNELFEQYIPKEEWLGYFEAHIEQGPLLCKEELSVGLVSGIASQTRVSVHWKGVAGHAGTSPMNLRIDALCAAAEFINVVELVGNKYNKKLVATVGKLSVEPNTSNVIPGYVSHTLDIRSPNDSFLITILAHLEEKALDIADRRKLSVDWEILQTNSSITCDGLLKEILGKSIEKGVTGKLVEMASGAGHDAVMISKVAPVIMLFVRCKDGISHNPLEHVATKDIKTALSVCNHFMDELIQSSKL